MSRLVEVTELVLRDGHQSVLATRMATEDMVGACEDIDQAGFWSVECWEAPRTTPASAFSTRTRGSGFARFGS